jgi:glycosyltransferase involved in cell wall biosynthesis
VDDGSTDGSRALLAGYAGRIRAVLQENRGQAAAINAGVRASRGEILCFLDSDDWWAPDKLAAVTAAFAADPGAVLAYHRLRPVDADGAPALKPIPRSLCAGNVAPRLLRSAGWWPFPMTSSVAVRRSAWAEAGDIPESFRISADAWLVGIYPFLGRVAALPGSLGFYRIHDNNWYRAREDAAMLRRRMAHWEATVEATNRFLQRRGAAARLSLADHLPHRLAAARLAGASPAERLALGLAALAFGGEPNALRRARDALRILWPTPGVAASRPAPRALS